MRFDRGARRAAEDASTTLSSAAYGRRIGARPRSRSGLIVHAAAVIAGTTIGGALALRAEPARSPAVVVDPTPARSPLPSSPSVAPSAGSRQLPTPTPARSAGAADSAAATVAGSTVAGSTAAGSTAAGSTAVVSLAASPDARGAAVAQIKDAVLRFVAWSRSHAGARCPDAAALGMAPRDPWGHPLLVLCADQPADQIAGVLSLGPDGLPGTDDDIASWALAPELAELLRGPRWSSARRPPVSPGGRLAAPVSPDGPRPAIAATPRPAAAPPPATTTSPAPAAPAATNTRPPASAGAGSDDTDGDGIPDRR
jgi:hypothetical protein